VTIEHKALDKVSVSVEDFSPRNKPDSPPRTKQILDTTSTNEDDGEDSRPSRRQSHLSRPGSKSLNRYDISLKFQIVTLQDPTLLKEAVDLRDEVIKHINRQLIR
jgi:hypothetical protein